MIKVYWRPRGISRWVLAVIAVASLGGLAAVELIRTTQRQPYYAEKLDAAHLAAQAFDIIRQERAARGVPLDVESDPARSGLIGALMSPVTTATAPLSAKRTTVNPNFAAVIVEMLCDAGVRQGDTIAVGCSGSFPALNACVFAAATTLGLNTIVISSASASQFGANHPEFLWIDMEAALNARDQKHFPHRSIAASLGGVEDRAVGLPAEGRKLLEEAIKRNGLQFIDSKDFTDGIDRRMELYKLHAGRAEIKAYVNLGGGAVSVGSSVGKKLFAPGLSRRKPVGVRYVDSVMTRFIDQGVPVIHLVQVEQLARAYGLPVNPAVVPAPGEGKIFRKEQYNPWLAGGVLLAIIVGLYAVIRSGVGHRIPRQERKQADEGYYEPMV